MIALICGMIGTLKELAFSFCFVESDALKLLIKLFSDNKLIDTLARDAF
jgi:hypothetical protein